MRKKALLLLLLFCAALMLLHRVVLHVMTSSSSSFTPFSFFSYYYGDTLGGARSSKQRLLVAVLTHPQQLELAYAGFRTWATTLPKDQFTVQYFVGSCEARFDPLTSLPVPPTSAYDSFFRAQQQEEGERPAQESEGASLSQEELDLRARFFEQIRCVEATDDYPPQNKVFALWDYLAEHHLHEYDWFLKVDHDTYLNPVQLELFLNNYLRAENVTENLAYIGLPLRGRASEIDMLGLDGHRYCHGLGYFLNRASLTVLTGKFKLWLPFVASNHSDTEIGRFMYNHTLLECQEPPLEFRIYQFFYRQTENNTVHPLYISEGGQMVMRFVASPRGPHFDSVLVHPLKYSHEIYRFFKQSQLQLRPVQQISKPGSDPVELFMVQKEIWASCAYNIARSREKSPTAMPKKCALDTAMAPATSVSLPRVVHVLSADVDSYEVIVKKLDHYSNGAFKPVRHAFGENYQGITAKSIVLTMAELFAASMAERSTHLLMVAEKVHVCNRNLVAVFEDTIRNPNSSCAPPVLSSRPGGVLVLGAAFDYSYSWATLFRHSSIDCIDYFSRSVTPSAALFHPNTYEYALGWLRGKLNYGYDQELMASLTPMQLQLILAGHGGSLAFQIQLKVMHDLLLFLADEGFIVSTMRYPLFSLQSHECTKRLNPQVANDDPKRR